jgi:hypothetical protein
MVTLRELSDLTQGWRLLVIRRQSDVTGDDAPILPRLKYAHEVHWETKKILKNSSVLSTDGIASLRWMATQRSLN